MREVRRLPEITRDDVRALVGRVGDGTIPSADIYRAYCEMMAERNREPVTSRKLGSALRDARQRPTVKYVDRKNIRAWVIRERFLEWMTPGLEEPQTLDDLSQA